MRVSNTSASGCRVLPYGETALLVEGPPGCGPRLFAALTSAALPGVAEMVPAARTVLLRLVPSADPARLRDVLDTVLSRPLPPLDTGSAGPPIEIGVIYDGPDLAAVAALTGLDVAAVVAAHTGRCWRVAFGGFAPGFAYLDDGDPRLEVPRRQSPRPAVPAGAVGLAGRYCGIYPRVSPGGWQLIGHTDVALWELHRTPPALLNPGALVRFVAVVR